MTNRAFLLSELSVQARRSRATPQTRAALEWDSGT